MSTHFVSDDQWLTDDTMIGHQPSDGDPTKCHPVQQPGRDSDHDQDTQQPQQWIVALENRRRPNEEKQKDEDHRRAYRKHSLRAGHHVLMLRVHRSIRHGTSIAAPPETCSHISSGRFCDISLIGFDRLRIRFVSSHRLLIVPSVILGRARPGCRGSGSMR